MSVDVEHQLTRISRTEDRYTHHETNPTGCIVFILWKHNFVLASPFYGEKFYLLKHSIKLILLILLPAAPDIYVYIKHIQSAFKAAFQVEILKGLMQNIIYVWYSGFTTFIGVYTALLVPNFYQNVGVAAYTPTPSFYLKYFT